jgi:hypothetical protein
MHNPALKVKRQWIKRDKPFKWDKYEWPSPGKPGG